MFDKEVPGRLGADTPFDLGMPRSWKLTHFRRRGGPFLFFDYRRKKSTNINSVMAMYAEIFHRHLGQMSCPYKVLLVLRGLVKWAGTALAQFWQTAKYARSAYGSSPTSQAAGMFRAWAVRDLTPVEYYDAHLSRHPGTSGATNYLGWNVLSKVLIQLQRDTFGEPPFALNDKAAFGAWCRASHLPSPPEIVLDPVGPAPNIHALRELGDRLFVKLRSGAVGVGAQAWQRESNGLWHQPGMALSDDGLLEYLARRAAADPVGVGLVVQKRLYNHPDLQKTCGTTLSTWRVTTLLNEKDSPELIHWHWRMATEPDAITDNIGGGGTGWIAYNLETAEIGNGYSNQGRRIQALLTHHPVTGRKMAGTRFPFAGEVRSLAIRAHAILGNVLVVGWDIAVTEKGPVILEMNAPPMVLAIMQIAWGGFDDSRMGEILGWRARNWIKKHVDPASRRRISENCGIN